MAAELSTLISLFLDSKPEKYASFFLDCVNSKQQFNTEKIPDEWIGKVNSFLNSKTDSWIGVCLLGTTIEQCDTDTFTKNCVSWVRTILQLIQNSDRPELTGYCSKLIDEILRYAIEFSELSREVSNASIPSIISAILSNKSTDKPHLLSILYSCISYFPGPTVPFKNQIESFLLPLLNSPCEETRKNACRCFALLPRCIRDASSGKNVVCPWQAQWNKIVHTIHMLLDVAYEHAEEVDSVVSVLFLVYGGDICLMNRFHVAMCLLINRSQMMSKCAVLRPSGKAASQPEVLPLGDIAHAEPGRTYALVTRCNSLLTCLSTMIREDFDKVVTIPNDATVSLVTRILAVTGNSLKRAVIVESVLLRASLPLIHQNAVDLLTSLMARCGSLMLPYCDILINCLLQELSWTKCQSPMFGHEKPYRQLRCSVYLCLEHWVHLTKSLPDGSGVVSKLIEQILDDMMPVTSQTKLLPSTAQNSGSSKMSKKVEVNSGGYLPSHKVARQISTTFTDTEAKKRKLQEDVQQTLAGQQKFDTSANDMLTYRALKALSAILVCCGGDIPPDKFKEIQMHVVKLISQCQQSVVHAFPIPFGRADCRQALYNVLLCCLLTDSPNVPSPVNHAVRLFSYGLQDADLKVSSFCQEALAISNSVIHPRSFPQVCSASGPLLVTTTEQPSTNGSFPMAHCQSVPESHMLGPLGQLNTQTVSQSILNGGVFRNDTSGVSTQTCVNSVGYREHREIPEDSNFEVTSLADKSNHSIEETELSLSNGHLETSYGDEIESSDYCQGETGSSTATDAISHMSVLQPTASSLNALAARVLNTQGFLTDPGKGHSDSTKKQSVNQAPVEEREDISSSTPKKQGESTMVASQFKRRRVENNSNKSDGEVCGESSATGQSKDHLSGGTKDSSQATGNGDDETSEMLSAFVDSYPDSDDQVIS